MVNMYETKIFIKDYPVFIGSYKKEQKKKSLIDLEIKYVEKDIIDYSKVYDTVVNVLKNKRFILVEDLIDHLKSDLKKIFKKKTRFQITVRKKNPYLMKKCKYVEIKNVKG